MHLIHPRPPYFPPHEAANEDGLLCAGGDLSEHLLLHAYRNGIFPWYEGHVPLWWSPDPRWVLFPDELKVSQSMKQVLRQQRFSITCNKDPEAVMRQCMLTEREGQDGTWISEEVIRAYMRLSGSGHLISFEAWQQEELVGGLYGVLMGRVFFGESMFSKVSNASKAAFITGVRHLQQMGIALIDCQVHTHHLESLGARPIGRSEFLHSLDQLIPDDDKE